MELKSYFAQDSEGNILPGAVVYLYKRGTTTTVSVYDKNGAPKANPFTAESNGFVQFSAADGEYDLRISSGGRDYTISVSLLDTLRLHFESVARNIGCTLADGSFEDGAIITAPTQLVLNKSTQRIFEYTGTISEGLIVAPRTDPIVGSNWVDKTKDSIYDELTREGQSTHDIASQSVKHHSGRIGYASLPRLIRSFINYDDAAATEIQILCLGSSVGNGASLPDPLTQAPVKYLTQRINALFNKLGNKTINSYNRSVNGSTLTDGVTALANALAEPLTPKLTVLVFGMNDGGTANYNAGQTYPFVYTRTVEIIEKAKKAGSDVVVLTTPHPHSDRIGWSMPAGVPQVYPVSVASPINDSVLIPTAANSIKHIDATGDGTIIPVSYRHMRVNEAQRRAAADCGVPVIDAEWYWFKAVGQEGQDALFNAGEFAHPNLLGHKLSYWNAIDDFIESLTASVISGNQQTDFQQRSVAGLSASQSPMARNHLRQSAYNMEEAVALFDTSDGLSGVGIDKEGNLYPVNSATAEWVQPSITKQKQQYASTQNYFTVDRRTAGDFNISTGLNVAINTDGAFELWVKAEQSGIGVGWQFVKIHGYNKDGTITFVQDWTQGESIVTITASGANIVITPNAANTNLHYRIETMSL